MKGKTKLLRVITAAMAALLALGIILGTVASVRGDSIKSAYSEELL